jgi:tRNA threonylcarbamoyladenosine biosynthesis protein TsaB
MAKILAIETSTTWASVALLNDETVVAEKSSGIQRTHSEFVNEAIQQIFDSEKVDLSQIDLFAVGIGPGSFTGIRVGLNIIKTFAYLYSRPIYCVDSLAILHKQAGGECLTMINAYKNMVYWSAFNKSERIDGPSAIPFSEIEKRVEMLELQTPLPCVGDGYIAYERFFSSKLKQLLQRSTSAQDYPRASTLGKMAYHREPVGKILNWNTILPLYIRASEAEENLKQ